MAIEEEVIPLPSELSTPPVTKIYLVFVDLGDCVDSIMPNSKREILRIINHTCLKTIGLVGALSVKPKAPIARSNFVIITRDVKEVGIFALLGSGFNHRCNF